MTQLSALKDPDTLARRLPAVVTESSLCAADAHATLSDLAALGNAFQVIIGGGIVLHERAIARLRVTHVLLLCMSFLAHRSAVPARVTALRGRMNLCMSPFGLGGR